MPYDPAAELPDSVKGALPRSAQQGCRDAFNGAWSAYPDAKNREARAHTVIWATVRRKHKKRGGEWVKR
jgi:cation transport regulator ChaB